MILERIIAHKREELRAAKGTYPLAGLQARARATPQPRDLGAALRTKGVSLIAEVKRASPSRGLLCPDFDPVRLATIYARFGVAAISVLTDERFFQGSLRYLTAIREALGEKCPPLLRKDFILDPYQLYEARAHGADAILLIAAILGDDELRDMLALATELGLGALVEVHEETDLRRALAAGARLIGLNNRDLRDFGVDLTVTERLRALVPSGVTLVSESGIRRREDIRRLARCHVDAALVGEALVTAPDVAARVSELVRAGQEAISGRVKICGLTNVHDAQAAVEAGARTLGFVFHPLSRRAVTPQEAREIIRGLPPEVNCVGVMVDQPPGCAQAIADLAGLTAIQWHGHEPDEWLRATNVPAIKAISVRDAGDLRRLQTYPSAEAFLVDAWSPAAAGGTGVAWDWSLASELPLLMRPLVLAGGLTPENVAAAIRRVRPSAVDVSSGVEVLPGRKDHEKVRRFVATAMEAFHELETG